MPYIAPYVDAAGLHIPSYNDILEELIEQMKSIYGQDIYLGNDSADRQMLSIFALKMYETLEDIQLAFNNRGPSTAVGSGLDVIVKINGLSRKTATHSTCTVTLTGVGGTVIQGGVVSDVNGNKWNLPETVTIGADGTATVTAICQALGPVTALSGDINSISTPTLGWTSVTNAAAASIGLPAETDAQLRARQALSTKFASHTMLAGTISAIAATPGVTRYKILENNTDAYDLYGNPPHSITCVVEGGTNEDIAKAIFFNRGLGCYIHGDVIVPVTDPDTMDIFPVRFFRPQYIPIYVEMSITPFEGYVNATRTAIRESVTNYLNSLQIGEDLTISALYGAALSVIPNLAQPLFSITAVYAGENPSPVGTTDIYIDYNEVTQGIIDNIVIIEP